MPAATPVYPVALLLGGRRCLVVGGGHVAERKAAGLLAAGAEVHVVATRVMPVMRELPGLASVEERPYRAGDAAGYWLVVAATGDATVNQQVFDDGEAAGVWVNSADDPERCSFMLPAVTRRGPVTVAVSTSGYSPALASWLKAQFAAQMGPELAELAELLAGARAELKAQGRSTEGIDWRPGLGPDMLELIRQGRRAEAKERLEACLSR
ncbi:MAG TPA: bifunctional precorrin-2 dehydrogenase/sirohydrochlorin ferrochelatase [Acidimicrobiales bacterium]|nr:bifunctional precorrin-2 dehydrogenase/sirohydrochlorin ferrochelatase [Acidimicrobiales bacterium]